MIASKAVRNDPVDNFGLIGFIIVGLFLASWAISTIIYKVKRYDDIEVKITPRSVPALPKDPITGASS